MATAERLTELTQIVTNLARGRTDYVTTNGAGGTGQFDNMIHRALGAGDNEANGLMEGVADDIPVAADAAALAGFYSIQRLVLSILTPDDTPASTQNGKKKVKDIMPASVVQG